MGRPPERARVGTQARSAGRPMLKLGFETAGGDSGEPEQVRLPRVEPDVQALFRELITVAVEALV